MAGGSSQPGRSVTSKTLAILEAFESGARGLSLTELSQLSGIPLSTTHRLVGELEQWGALTRDRQGRLQIGLRLWELTQSAGRDLRDTARPFLQDLFSLTGETAHLAIRDGLEALYIDRVYSTRRVPRATRVGGRLPLNATAVGKVLLAFETPEIREAVLSQELPARTKHTITDPDRLRAELASIRGQGYATALGQVRDGSCSIAVPVMHSGRIGAAIGVVTHTARSHQLLSYLPVLRSVGERIEHATRLLPLESLLGSFSTKYSRTRKPAPAIDFH